MSARSSSVASSHRSSKDGSQTSAQPVSHKIQLIDRTEDNDGESEPNSPISPSRSIDLSLRFSRSSLHKQLVQRKHAKWQQSQEQEQGQQPEPTSATSKDPPISPVTAQPTGLPEEESRLARGRSKLKNFLNPRASALLSSTEASHLDMLYENQRGTFFFGIPFFSSNSLLNFDPPAWQNAQFHASPVDITNAQVPDPSWEWEWQRWYVDMSRDVDEEGWEYSFKFGGRFAWHGTNPWWCSFVRRRRWLRRRVRVKMDGKVDGDKDPLRSAHHFNAEYFTIHPTKENSETLLSSTDREKMTAPAAWKGTEDEPEEEQDVKDIATLMSILRSATVDREKIVAVQNFINQGGEELFYLSDEMPHILSLLVYQSSRRQLLSLLLEKIDRLHGEAHQQSDDGDEGGKNRELDYLHRALDTADKETKRLEYWSDFTRMSNEGETARAEMDERSSDVEESGSQHAAGAKPKEETKNSQVDKGKGKEKVSED